jgi:putative NIF3 family GTP cyclohydrolase 1 type 2
MCLDGRSSVARSVLSERLSRLLEPERFKDYGPNGLQVEGRPQVQKIVSGVTASLALIEAAVQRGADAILVHHGLFWRGQDGRVTGWMKQRLALLLAHDINLFAYQLGLRLGLQAFDGDAGRFGEIGLGFLGGRSDGSAFDSPQALARHVELALGRPVTLVAGGQTGPRTIGWCSGGAQSYFEAAIAAGAQAFITGEISEPQAHLARETGVSFIACGHHASERYGAPAVAAHLAAELGLAHEFVDIDNPA